jgi:hydrogenase nickel incorporation protein HypA/HybF
MHELAIAQKIIETIEEEANKNGMTKVRSAKLKIGKMAAFEKEHLEFCLKTYEKTNLLEDMEFEIEEVPVELICKSCAQKFLDARFDDEEFAHEISHAPALYVPPSCPVCSSEDVTMTSGNEMMLISIEGE